MEDEYTKLQKLFVALQKPHRECLYDLSNPDYKNNNKKQIVWAEIAEEMAMSKNNVQSLWKRIKIKYRAALGKENAPSGSGRITLRPMESFLMKEMDFLRPYLEDDDETYGKCLTLDGIIQCTSRDEFAYQEMISFLPLCCHPNPEKVLIVGGGDGGVAREVVKHPLVKEVHQIEIDDRVVELSKLYLPNMAKGFESDKLSLIIGDGFGYMDRHKKAFDVIITDSSDPVGPALNLFNASYFGLMKCALREGGIICSQGGSYWLDCNHVKTIINRCKSHFTNVAYAVTSVPSYPCGHIGFVLGSLDETRALENPVKIFSSTEIDNMELKYYTSSMHSASFVLPRKIHKHIYG